LWKEWTVRPGEGTEQIQCHHEHAIAEANAALNHTAEGRFTESTTSDEAEPEQDED
jgi:hypothetical protein